MLKNYDKIAGDSHLVGRFTVKHKDFYNMKDLYISMREWLIKNEYVDRNDPYFPETLMLEKIKQEIGKEIWVYWRTEKSPTGSSFFRYLLDLEYHIILMKTTEVMHEGVKYKTNWGECELRFKARLVTDPDGKWQENWFLKSIFKIFIKRMIKPTWDMHRRTLYRDAYKFQNESKEFLKLKSFLPEPETRFFPPMGLPVDK